MKVTLENTSKIVDLVIEGKSVPARVWQGQTEGGIPVQAFITLISPEISTSDPRIDELTVEFERDLTRMADRRASVESIPMRMIL